MWLWAPRGRVPTRCPTRRPQPPLDRPRTCIARCLSRPLFFMLSSSASTFLRCNSFFSSVCSAAGNYIEQRRATGRKLAAAAVAWRPAEQHHTKPNLVAITVLRWPLTLVARTTRGARRRAGAAREAGLRVTRPASARCPIWHDICIIVNESKMLW